MNAFIVNFLTPRMQSNYSLLRFCVPFYRIQQQRTLKSPPGSSSDSTSVSPSVSPIFGSTYTKKLVYYPDAYLTKDLIKITNDELPEKMGKLIEGNEKIQRIEYHTSPLSQNELFRIYFHHAFVVFKTESWYWSLEKNTAAVIMQRCKHFERVHDTIQGSMRSDKTTKLTEAQGENGLTMTRLIEFVHIANSVNDPYSVHKGNCQHFALKIYNRVEEEFRSIQMTFSFK